MLKPEGRRCWTLIYAEDDGVGFHLDALPCVPKPLTSDSVPHCYACQAIDVTDKHGNGSYTFGKSNPNGFADWFKDRQRPAFNRVAAARKTEIVQNYRTIYARVDDVPDALVRTPLQRLVQVLKRHRDARFSGHPQEDDKPISIIVTTLSALAYQQEADVFSSLANFLDRVERFQDTGIIRADGETWVIPNPVNPKENFADRWNDPDSKKSEAFFWWLACLREDIDELLNAASQAELERGLRKAFGDTPGGRVAGKYRGPAPGAYTPKNSSFFGRVVGALSFNVSHKKPPAWRISPRLHTASISATYSRSGFRPRPFVSNSPPLQKGWSLKFEAHTDVPKPYKVFWQVVNTGSEATLANQLRGDFYDSTSSRVRTESTKFTGMHWVECFIVKDDVCVARSGEFVVNIA